MALKKVRGNLERIFDKNLTDLVRGIRNNKDNEAKFIAQCIEEIKQELRQENISVKATAVAKLTYLQMLGYDISWAGFNIIEVMSCSKFTYKRIGYLASSQSFHTDTELLMLTTNMIRKDLNSQNQYDAGVALSALSCFISADLARDLANDIMTLLSSTKPYLRKKAVLMMYKVFLRFPEALRPAFPRLKEKLEDSDQGVQSAAVNVICELARKNPKNYLSLAPIFFKLMTASTNNWMLIKIIKLFGALTPLEPRLGKKLIEPLTNLIHSTSAMSLLYECINTVIAVLISISSSLPNHSACVQLCVQKLRILIEDSDQNLKYLGLLAMSKILKTHPKTVQSHKDLIMQCLDDKDESIRLRALDLLYGMVSKKTLMEIVKKLMVHMDRAEGTLYRDELLSKIIDICSQNNYQFIVNFEWYVSVLVELTRMDGSQHGVLVAHQMLDVAIRVQAIRKFAVEQMAILLENAHILTQPSSKMVEVLYAAAWICGEYAVELVDPEKTLLAMLEGKVNALPSHIQSVYVQNILKILCIILKNTSTEHAIELCRMISNKLPQFVSSGDLEVQERASSALQLVELIQHEITSGNMEILEEFELLFNGELNPVAPKAQRKVQVPEGLDLDVWINDPPSSSSDENEDEQYESENVITNIFVKSEQGKEVRRKYEEPSERDLEKLREARRLEMENNPHYLKPDISNRKNNENDSLINNVDPHIPNTIPGLASSDKYLTQNSKKNKSKKIKKKKCRRNMSEEENNEEESNYVIVNRGRGEMPEGAEDSGGETDEHRDTNDPHAALDIDLEEPLSGISSTSTKKKTKLKKPSSNKKIHDQDILYNKYEIVESESVINEKTKKKKKKKKHDDQKPLSQKKLKSKNVPNVESNFDLLILKDGYEEASGISTPSKEILYVENSQSFTTVSNSYVKVVKNKILSVEYTVMSQVHKNIIIISLRLKNTTLHEGSYVKNIEFRISENSKAQLVAEDGTPSPGIKLPFELSSQTNDETKLYFKVQDVTKSYKIPSILTYSILENNSLITGELELKLKIPVTSLLLGVLPSEPFADLIASGQLMYDSSLCLPCDDFNEAVDILCRRCRLVLLERIQDTVSLYGSTSSGHHLCFLLKLEPKQRTIILDAKCNSENLLKNFFKEIKPLFSV